MKTDEYLMLSHACDEIGDEFYRCVSAWVRDSREQDASLVCRDLGHQYSEALINQLRYLNDLQPDARRDRAISTCESYRESLAKSLGLLDAPFNHQH